MQSRRISVAVTFFLFVAVVSRLEAAPSVRVLSKSTASLRAHINGVPGELTLARFRCPWALHVATCGLGWAMGDPIFMGLFAHAGLKAMELWAWAEFYPEDGSRLPELSYPAQNFELLNQMKARIQSEATAARALLGTGFGAGTIEFRGGYVEMFLEERMQCTEQFVYSRYGTSTRLPRYQSYFEGSFAESKLLYEDSATHRFVQVSRRGEDQSAVEISPACADTLLFYQMR